MKRILSILSLIGIFAVTHSLSYANAPTKPISIEFYGDTLHIPFDATLNISYDTESTNTSVKQFYDAMDAGDYKPVISELMAFKEVHHLNDWFFYQLIRKTAQAISPKEANYPRYTLYKWFFLAKSGYDANIAICDGQLIFYVRSEENIYDIPYYTKDGKHYVCLNIHDYSNRSLNFEKDGIYPVDIHIPEAERTFSYRITQVPDFSPNYYAEKKIQFNYDHKLYRFRIMVNPQMQTIFANYPVVDIESYFNIPLSGKTYNSLIPELRNAVAKMDQKQGVDYLMEFTRNVFEYKDDKENFGKEKRLSPEQTLLNKYSDCDDRAAFFFYLVKEIYNLPMIALLYPTHLTIAVQFDDPPANSITYNGNKYAVCEPTYPLLPIGQVAPELQQQHYEVAYAYDPK